MGKHSNSFIEYASNTATEKFEEIKTIYKKYSDFAYWQNDLEIINTILEVNSKTIVCIKTNIHGMSMYFIMNDTKFSKAQISSGFNEANKLKNLHDYCYVNCEKWFGNLPEVIEIYHDEMKSIVEKLLLEKLSKDIKTSKRNKL